jgi:hypothetical protein
MEKKSKVEGQGSKVGRTNSPFDLQPSTFDQQSMVAAPVLVAQGR